MAALSQHLLLNSSKVSFDELTIVLVVSLLITESSHSKRIAAKTAETQ